MPKDLNQKMGALAHANAIRSAGAAVKAELRAGAITLAEALDDERASRLEVLALLKMLPYYGRPKAIRLVTSAQASPFRRVGELTARQKGILVEGYDEYVQSRRSWSRVRA